MISENNFSDASAAYSVVLRKVMDRIERAEYQSNDPYDLLGTRLIVWLRSRKNNPLNTLTKKEPDFRDKIIRRLLSPIYQTTYAVTFFRFLFGVRHVQHPKTMGLMLQGYATLYRTYKDPFFLEKAKYCADWLMNNADQHKYGKYCWGLPWEWPNGDEFTIPAYGPQSTLSAVNGLGFVDLFELTGENKYLEVATSVCEFFLQSLNLHKVSGDAWAFSYTPYDRSHIINVNFHCAALLMRVWEKTNISEFHDTAIKVCNFSIREQRSDGAWYYSSALDGYVNAVDNTHTGDNLEYLSIIKSVMKHDFPYESEFARGVEYYLNHFIADDGQPFYTDAEKFPVESHPACQMLITLSQITPDFPDVRPVAVKLANWILEHLMNGRRDQMYYRVYETGFTDKTYSISWGDAWLVKGLSLLLYRLQKLEDVV